MKTVVIGGGIGGYSCAIRLAQLGAEVILVEKDLLGGTCLNRGCIPAKTILHTARLFHEMKDAEKLGIRTEGISLQYGKTAARKDEIVAKLRSGVAYLMKKNRITVLTGTAEFLSDQEIRVTGETGTEVIMADRFVIATGSVPVDLSTAPRDGEVILDSRDALSLTELPGSLIVLGGGVIGCELAQAFAMLGTQVTIVELLPRLLANMDADLSEVLQKRLRADGISIRTGTRLVKAEKNTDGVTVTLEKNGTEETLSSEKLLVAVGRRPYTDGLGLSQTSVRTGEKGEILIDEYLQTTAQDIYAVGDVTGGLLQLAHAASHQGVIAAENCMGEEREWDPHFVPSCVYTCPELASIGDTEEEADSEVLVGSFPLSANGRAMIEDGTEGFVKVVTDAEEDTILGVQMAGPFATEMISGMAGVVAFEADTSDVGEWIFAHPTVSEAVGEAVMDVHKRAIHK